MVVVEGGDSPPIQMEHKVIVLIRFQSLNNLGWLETVWCTYSSTRAIKQESNRLLYLKTLGWEQIDFPSPSTQFGSSCGIISHSNYYISSL